MSDRPARDGSLASEPSQVEPLRSTGAAAEGTSSHVVLAWVVLSVAIVAMGGIALWGLDGSKLGAAPPPEAAAQARGPEASVPVRNEHPPILRLAGSGTNLPLTRALVRAFAAHDSTARPFVHESIGSAGGVQALRDGVIDIALSSRALTGEELDADLVAIPYALVAVVFATNLDVPTQDLTARDVLAMYSGQKSAWADGGRVTVVQREQGDSANLAAHAAIPGFAAVDDAARAAGRWRVVHRDRDMQEALLSTPGGVGLFDLGAIVAQLLPLRVMTLDGVDPHRGAVFDGTYPMHKPLAFVVRRSLARANRNFFEFVFSPAGRKLIDERGYISLPGPPDLYPHPKLAP